VEETRGPGENHSPVASHYLENLRLTWFIRYVFLSNFLQFLNHVIIAKTKFLLPQAYVTIADVSGITIIRYTQRQNI
jgi:hypothetical protein